GGPAGAAAGHGGGARGGLGGAHVEVDGDAADGGALGEAMVVEADEPLLAVAAGTDAGATASDGGDLVGDAVDDDDGRVGGEHAGDELALAHAYDKITAWPTGQRCGGCHGRRDYVMVGGRVHDLDGGTAMTATSTGGDPRSSGPARRVLLCVGPGGVGKTT